jgi:UDP:flavonoid glycosyltransferase YjiC (YdhE family)
VRLLFTCRQLTGHLHPLLPLAEAAAERGHDVAFATGEPALADVRSRGFAAHDVDFGGELRAEFLRRFGSSPSRATFWAELFVARELPARLPALIELVRGFDLVVHEVAELAAPLAATLAGVPYATSGFGPLVPREIVARAAAAAEPHWRAHGLRPHPRAGLFDRLYLDPCPPALQRPEAADLPVQSVRLSRLPARPPSGEAVYVTLGTIWNKDLSVFRTVLDGLREREVIVTLGADGDPAALGPQPPNVRVQRFVAQAEVLPRCAAVVCHAGAGTMLGTLAHGLPMLMLPQGADHHDNVERVVAAGAGLTLEELTPAGVAAAVARLEDLRPAARRIAAEIAALPPPAAAIARLETLWTQTA